MKSAKSQKKLLKNKMENIALQLLNNNQKWKKKFSPSNSRNKVDIKEKDDKEMSIDTQKDFLTLIKSKKLIKNPNAKININKNNNNKNFSNYNSFYNKKKDFLNLKEEEKEKIRKKSQIPKNKKAIVPKIKGLEIIVQKHINNLNREPKKNLNSINCKHLQI